MEQEEEKKLVADAAPPTADQLESLKKRLDQNSRSVALGGESKADPTTQEFNEELAVLCRKYSIVALFGAVQLDEAGSAGVISFRADPWRRIGLSDLIQTIADKALENIKV